MAGKSDTFENDLLKLIFNGTAITGVADNASSSPLTSLYVSLHTADPTDAGDQTSNELSYTGYTRVAVARSGSGWTITGNVVTPTANVEFGAMTGGTGGTVTHWAIGTASTGTGKILYSGTVSPNIAMSTGVTPRLTTESTVTED